MAADEGDDVLTKTAVRVGLPLRLRFSAVVTHSKNSMFCARKFVGL